MPAGKSFQGSRKQQGATLDLAGFWREKKHLVFHFQDFGKQQENFKDLGEDFGKDFSESEFGGTVNDFSAPPQDQPHKPRGAEGPSYTYIANGPFPDSGESGDSSSRQSPISAKVNAKLFGGFRDPSNPFATGSGQSRTFHQDHSSVGGLTAEDIDKARQAKADPQHKPHKQMVRRMYIRKSRVVVAFVKTSISVSKCPI